MENNSDNVILVKKASGEEEAFSTEKLKHSLLNAGAAIETALHIVADIKDWIYPGITTKKIYSRAFSILRSEKTSTALRYRLKQAILELGPSGHPFECLIGELFKKQGFRAEVGIVVEGRCVTHEMDVIATQNNMQYLVECKYHKDQGKLVSVQVPLYVHSRVDDIVYKRKEMPEYQGLTFKGSVITNTRFSSDSIQYGNCSGLELLAWDYPHGNGLKHLLEKYRLYPVTVLNNLTIKDKQSLLNHSIVTCEQLQKHPEYLKNIDFNKNKFGALMKELEGICG